MNDDQKTQEEIALLTRRYNAYLADRAKKGTRRALLVVVGLAITALFLVLAIVLPASNLFVTVPITSFVLASMFVKYNNYGLAIDHIVFNLEMVRQQLRMTQQQPPERQS